MKEENKFIAFFKRIFHIKPKYLDEEESIKIKRDMCFRARKSELCDFNPFNCKCCAWRVEND